MLLCRSTAGFLRRLSSRRGGSTGCGRGRARCRRGRGPGRRLATARAGRGGPVPNGGRRLLLLWTLRWPAWGLRPERPAGTAGRTAPVCPVRCPSIFWVLALTRSWVDQASLGPSTARRRIRPPRTSTASRIGCLSSGSPRSSSSIAPRAASASYRRTVPRPSHQRSARTWSETSSPGGDIRSAKPAPSRSTGTTTALDPCATGPAIVSPHREHCSSTAAGSPANHSAPSVHQRGISRNDCGNSITPAR